MYSQFEGSNLASVDMPGFGAFGDVAMAFGLPHIHKDVLKSKLRVSAFANALAAISVLYLPCCCVSCCQFRSIGRTRFAMFLSTPSPYIQHACCILN